MNSVRFICVSKKEKEKANLQEDKILFTTIVAVSRVLSLCELGHFDCNELDCF